MAEDTIISEEEHGGYKWETGSNIGKLPPGVEIIRDESSIERSIFPPRYELVKDPYSAKAVAEDGIMYENYKKPDYSDISDERKEELKGKVEGLFSNPKILALQHNCDFTKAERDVREGKFAEKYKDYPSVSDLVDKNKDGLINEPEKEDWDTRLWVGDRTVRASKEDVNKMREAEETYGVHGSAFYRGLREELDKAMPNATEHEKDFARAAFYDARDARDKEKAEKAPEVLKEGQSVPAPAAIDPKILETTKEIK